jgi:hypothetical protein
MRRLRIHAPARNGRRRTPVQAQPTELPSAMKQLGLGSNRRSRLDQHRRRRPFALKAIIAAPAAISRSRNSFPVALDCLHLAAELSPAHLMTMVCPGSWPASGLAAERQRLPEHRPRRNRQPTLAGSSARLAGLAALRRNTSRRPARATAGWCPAQVSATKREGARPSLSFFMQVPMSAQNL